MSRGARDDTFGAAARMRRLYPLRYVVMKISISDSFLDAMRALDPADAKRVSAFAEKLVSAPETPSLHAEHIRDVQVRALRSLRVTRDLRAIAHFDCGRLLLLYVARHDAAYAWARNHCIECIVDGEEVRVRLTVSSGDGLYGIGSVSESRACLVETLEELRALLREYGIPLAHE